jgi:hypothetical protein
MYDENTIPLLDGGDFTMGRKAIVACGKENLALAKTQMIHTITLTLPVSRNVEMVYEM